MHKSCEQVTRSKCERSALTPAQWTRFLQGCGCSRAPILAPASGRIPTIRAEANHYVTHAIDVLPLHDPRNHAPIPAYLVNCHIKTPLPSLCGLPGCQGDCRRLYILLLPTTPHTVGARIRREHQRRDFLILSLEPLSSKGDKSAPWKLTAGQPSPLSHVLPRAYPTAE